MKMNELPLEGDKILLTAAQVADWRAQYANLSAERDGISARIAKLEEKLQAVALLTGTTIAAILGDSDDDDDGVKESLTAAIKRVVGGAGKPVSRQDIRSALSEDSELADRLKRSPNSFYNAMSRLLKRDEIRQDGERFTLA